MPKHLLANLEQEDQAELALARGANVVATARDAARLVGFTQHYGDRALLFDLDVTDESAAPDRHASSTKKYTHADNKVLIDVLYK